MMGTDHTIIDAKWWLNYDLDLQKALHKPSPNEWNMIANCSFFMYFWYQWLHFWSTSNGCLFDYKNKDSAS